MTVKDALKKMKDHYHGFEWNETSKALTHRIIDVLENQAGYVYITSMVERDSDNKITKCIKVYETISADRVNVGLKDGKQYLTYSVK